MSNPGFRTFFTTIYRTSPGIEHLNLELYEFCNTESRDLIEMSYVKDYKFSGGETQ